MPESKHRRKRRPRNSEREGPVLFRHPFSTVPRDALLKALSETAATTAVNFPAQLRELVSLIQSVDGLQAIALLAQYGLMGSIAEDGRIRPGYKGEEFNQAHVELTQAIALQTADAAKLPPTPDQMQKLFDLLPEIGRAYSRRRMIGLKEERTQDEKALGLMQEHLRLHTQTVRNWGYFDRVIRIVRDLCAPLDSLLRNSIGVSGSELIGFFEYLVREKEDRINARRALMRKVFDQKTPTAMIRTYGDLAHPNGGVDGAIQMIEQMGLGTEEVKAMVLNHLDLSLAHDLFIDVEQGAKAIGVQEGSLRAALDRLSLSFGDLKDTDTEWFFLDNPVWERPLIKCRGDRYFCALPQAFFSFVFPIFDRLIAHDASARQAYSRRRSDYLESEIRRMFEKAFPGSEMAGGYKWKDGNEDFENDLMVLVDSHLIIVEAKSGSISWPALRGAPDRAKKHVEELLMAPSKQSLRLMERVQRAIAEPDIASSLLPAFPLSIDRVKNVLRLSVTLEDFAVVQTNLRLAREAGWTADHPLAPCILLADLEIVLDVLELTALKIHYLKRRAELQQSMSYHGDELDLLGLYLATGFNIGEIEFDGTHLQLLMMSKPIDEYYMALTEGVQRPKPRPKLSKRWLDICRRLESRNFYQWSDVAVVVLAFSYDEQEKMERRFKKIAKNVHKNWRQPKHECAINIIPNRHRTDALSLYAFKEREKDQRRERMENIAGQVFESEHVKRCVILAVNIDRQDYPYSTLMVFNRG